MATRDEHDREILAVWTRMAQALERLAINTMPVASNQSAGLPVAYTTSVSPTSEPPKPIQQQSPFER